MKSEIKKYTCQNSIVIMIILFIMGKFGVDMDFGDSIWTMTIQRLVLGTIMFGVMYLIIGREAFVWTKKSGRYAFKRSLYQLILVSIPVLCTFAVAPRVSLFWLYIIFSFSVGFFEEGLFRGIIMNGFVKLLPKTKIGLWLAVIISSFIFGFAHVMDYVPYIEQNPISIILQMVNKIIAAGVFGMLLTAIYLKTKNIWTCVIIHALNDLLLFWAEVFTKPKSTFAMPQYVNVNIVTNQDVYLRLVLNLLLYIPNIIVVIMILRKLEPDKCVIWK